ncbi:MAG: hypothetical protein Q4C96_03730 [Planctomycetia bacterium]|nr:hypothetical protein [Planctomycetia bacterium]
MLNCTRKRMSFSIIFYVFFAIFISWTCADCLLGAPKSKSSAVVYGYDEFPVLAEYYQEINFVQEVKSQEIIDSVSTSTSVKAVQEDGENGVQEKKEKMGPSLQLPPLPKYVLPLKPLLLNPDPEKILSQYTEEEIQKNMFLQLSNRWKEASENFVMPSDQDILNAKNVLIQHANYLQKVFQKNQKEGESWKKMLKWDLFVRELQKKETADFCVLGTTYMRLSSGAFGLELDCFTQVRYAIQNYVTLHAVLRNEEAAKESYKTVAKMLSVLLAEAAKNPHGDTQRAVENCLRWMQWMGQAPELTDKTRSLWGTSNFVIHLTEHFFQNYASQEIEEKQTLNEMVNRAHIRGNPIFRGKTSIFPVPNENRAQLMFRLEGRATGQTVSTSGPAIIRSTADTTILGEKSIFFDGTGLNTLPATAKLHSNSKIISVQDVNGRAMIQNAARRRAYEQKPQTESILISRQTARLKSLLDSEFNARFKEANKTMRDNLCHQLKPRGLDVSCTRTSTTDGQMNVFTFLSSKNGLMAADSPPQMLQTEESPVDVFFSFHESALQNLASGFVGGMLLDKDAGNKFRAALPANLKMSEVPKEDEDDSAPAILFSNYYPVSVTFTADKKLELTINGTQFISTDKVYPALEIKVTYRLECQNGKLYFVRDGEFHLLPPNYDPEVDARLSASVTSIRRVMARRLKEIMDEKYELKNIPLNREGSPQVNQKYFQQNDMELVPVVVSMQEGWLQVGYRLAPVEKQNED